VFYDLKCAAGFFDDDEADHSNRTADASGYWLELIVKEVRLLDPTSREKDASTPSMEIHVQMLHEVNHLEQTHCRRVTGVPGIADAYQSC